MLALDTRIYAATLAALCGEPVLPYRLAPAAREIANLIAGYEEQAGGRLDLATTRARAAEAVRACEELDAAAHRLLAAHADPADPAARAVVERQKGVSRALIPLRYTSGARFDHDPAMPAPALQALRDTPRRATLDPGSDEARFLHTALVRRSNAVRHALRAAARAAGGTQD